MTASIKARSVVSAASIVLRALWGDERASTVTPISYRDGALTVETSSAGAVQQLRVDETRLVNEINRAMGERCVARLKVLRRGF